MLCQFCSQVVGPKTRFVAQFACDWKCSGEEPPEVPRFPPMFLVLHGISGMSSNREPQLTPQGYVRFRIRNDETDEVVGTLDVRKDGISWRPADKVI